MTGRIRADAQVRWLERNGFKVLRRADGFLLLARANFERVVSGGPPQLQLQQDEKQRPDPEPDWGAIDYDYAAARKTARKPRAA